MPSPILYPVAVKSRLSCTDPLHVNNFYEKQRVHWHKLQDRQQLVLYLANLHAAATSTGMPLGMVEITLPLSKLRKWIHDYRVVLDHFFEVRQLGYHLENDEFEFSKLIPKKLSSQTAVAASKAAANLEYEVPKRPDNCTISKVYVQQQNAEAIREYIKAKNRLDLLAPTEWLLKHPEVNFHFVRAGRLQLRDTSIWPIAGIENWPSKLRELLFGPGLDIDAAYTQFLVKTLQEVHAKSPELLKLLYPDLLKAIHDKQQWRADLCQKVLRLPFTDENIGLIKRICMSLANGSRISPGILLNGVAFSETADMIVQSSLELTPERLIEIGERFNSIARQYDQARRAVCLHLQRVNPTRKNLKSVFKDYFAWERVARYSIWEAIDRHGIMVHDGIDGVPQQYLDQLPTLIEQLGIRLTA